MERLSEYDIGDRLGAGSFGETYAATHRPTGREVAIKRLRVQDAPDWKAIELFEREGRTLATLNHPGIAAYIDAFAVTDPDRGETFYLVQERIVGESLAARLARGELMRGIDVVEFIREMAAVLTYIHGQNPPVIHRDLKPSNTMIRANPGSGPRFALIDFGAIQVALPRPDGQGGSTIIGTSGYMPTEQLLGRTVPASDLYALGATAVHAFTGVHPADMAVSRLTLDWRPHVPPGAALSERLVNAITGLLAPAVEDRIDSGRLLVERLDIPVVPPPTALDDARMAAASRKESGVVKGLAIGVVALVGFFVMGVVIDAVERERPPTVPEPAVPYDLIVEESAPPNVPISLMTMPDLAKALGTDPNPVGDALKLTLRAFDTKFYPAAAVLIENTSDEAWSDVRAAAFLIDDDGKTVAINDFELVAGYEGALQPGDVFGKAIRWNSKVTGVAQIIVRVLSAKRGTPLAGERRPLTPTWEVLPEPGVALTFALLALVDTSDGLGSRRVHMPRVAVTNTGEVAIRSLRLHKHLTDPTGKVAPQDKNAWAIAIGAPSLLPGETRTVSMWSWEDAALSDWSLSVRDIDVGSRL